jgi:hydrogenase nickel incorporation protein HypB
VTTRIVELRTKILKKNDELARSLREDFRRLEIFVANFVSGPGSGKTRLLTETLRLLNQTHRTAAVVGDLATENDARRLATSGSPVKQILTGTMCHLEADMVAHAVGDWDLSQFDFLFIENVGNLVCPSSWDLGEDLRVLLFSVTEGEDKPLKYPTLINSCDLVILSKIDLAEAVEFDVSAALKNIQEVRPGVEVLQISAKTGQGMDEWLRYLKKRLDAKRRTPSDSEPNRPESIDRNNVNPDDGDPDDVNAEAAAI